eukprot:COSAG05_NODE_2088_length_3587_cov_1323.072821_1_plen_345_part_00
MAALLGRGSSAPVLVVSLPTARVSPAVSPAASPERSRPSLVHHNLRWHQLSPAARTGRARRQLTAGPASPHPSLASLLSICGEQDCLDAFVAEGFVTMGEVKAAELNEADLRELGVGMKARKLLLQLLAPQPANILPVQLVYRGDFRTGPGEGNFTAIEAALRNIVVQELGLQAEKAAVTTAEQAVSSVTASTGKIKDQMNVLIRDEVFLIRDEMSSLRSAVVGAQQQTLQVQQQIQEAQQQTLSLLAMLLHDSQRLADLGHRTFETLRSMAQGDTDVPRLMTITAVDSAVWKGAWYENTNSNIASWLKSKAGISCSFRLHFLCEFCLYRGRSAPFCCSTSRVR